MLSDAYTINVGMMRFTREENAANSHLFYIPAKQNKIEKKNTTAAAAKSAYILMMS